MELEKENKQQEIMPGNVGTPQTSPVQTQTPLPQPIGIKDSDSKKKMLIITALCVLVLILASTTVYLLFQNKKTASSNIEVVPTVTEEISQTETPDPTADWETYINTKWGYEIKYPSSKLTHCNNNGASDYVGFWEASFPCPDGHDIAYILGIQGHTRESYSKNTRKPDSTESIAINGIAATKTKYIYTPDDGPLYSYKDSTNVVFESEGKLIVFNLIGSDYENTILFNQILTTFRSTSQPTDTSGWKTFKGSEMTFKYPPSWTQTALRLESINPKVTLSIIERDSSFMNECMQKTDTSPMSNVTVIKFKGVTTGEMCGGFDPNSREVWIAPTPDANPPGLQIRYQSKDSAEAEKIIDFIAASLEYI